MNWKTFVDFHEMIKIKWQVEFSITFSYKMQHLPTQFWTVWQIRFDGCNFKNECFHFVYSCISFLNLDAKCVSSWSGSQSGNNVENILSTARGRLSKLCYLSCFSQSGEEEQVCARRAVKVDFSTHCSLAAKTTITIKISLLFQNQLSFANANKKNYTKIQHFFPGRCNNVCLLFPHSNASGLKQVLPWLQWPIYCSTCKYLKWGQHLSSYKLCDIEITGVFFLRSPVLAMAIAVVLFCFYLYFKRKRTSNNVSIPTTQDDNTSLEFHTASPPGGQAEEHQRCDRFPPRYSTVDHPPPYSLVREPCYSGNDRLLCGKKGGKMSTCLSESTFSDGFSNYR